MSEQIRRIGNKATELARNIGRRHESGTELPARHRAAIQEIIQVPQGVTRDQITLDHALDPDIKARFARYLASETHTTRHKVEAHADHFHKRVWNGFRIGLGHSLGTAGAAGFIAGAPVGAPVIASSLQGIVSGLGATAAAAYMPLLVSAGFVAVPLASVFSAYWLTRRLREARETGNILSKTMKNESEMNVLREKVSKGEDVSADFDRIFNQERSTWRSKFLTPLTMLLSAGALGTYGAGLIKQSLAAKEWLASPIGQGRLLGAAAEAARGVVGENTKAVIENAGNIPWKAFSSGPTEISGFVKNFWTQAAGLFSSTPAIPRPR